MIPADQRLQPDETAGLHIHLGLVRQEQLASRDPRLQLGCQGHTFAHFRIHGAGEEPIGVPAFRFCPIKRDVRVCEKRFGFRSVRLVGRDADADSGLDLVAAEQKRLGHDLQKLVRQHSGIRRIADVRHQQGEFVTAKPGERVDRSHVRLQPFGNRAGAAGLRSGVPAYR